LEKHAPGGGGTDVKYGSLDETLEQKKNQTKKEVGL